MLSFRRQWMLEFVYVGALFTAGLTLAAAEVFFAAGWLGLASLVCLGSSLACVLIFATKTLWQRRWAIALIWTAVLLLFAPAALVSGLAAGLVGKMLRMTDHAPRTLPVDPSAMDKLTASGKQLADQLGTDFALDATALAFKPQRRELVFEVLAEQPGVFQAGIRFLQDADGGWKPDGHSCSGNTETFDADRRRFEEAFAKTSAPVITWPWSGLIEEQWIHAANGLAQALSSAGALDTFGLAWQLASISMSHSLRTGDNSVSISLNAKRGREVVASAVTYWAFDGKRALLTEATGNSHEFTASRSTMEHHTEVRSILEPWLASQDGLLAPSALFASRDDGTWSTCETVLPDGTALIYREQHAHPFLAEYHMRLEIRPPEGEPRDFLLPMNTGGRTAILVETGSLADGTPAVRVNAGRHFDLGFTLQSPRVVPAIAVLDCKHLGAFTGVKTSLRWASATDLADREVYETTRSYGFNQ